MSSERSEFAGGTAASRDVPIWGTGGRKAGLFDGVSGSWPSYAVLLLWVFIGIVAYQLTGVFCSFLFLALQGASLQDLLANQQPLLAEYGTELLGANAVGLALGLGGIALLASRLDSSRPLHYLRMKAFAPKDLILSCLSFLFLLPVVLGLGILNEQLPLPETLQRMEDQQMELIEWLVSGEGNFWSSLMFVAVTPALFEEMFFRGFMQRRAERAMGVTGGILLTGILFGLFHLRLTQVVPLAVLGCFFAYIAWSTGSLWIPIILHFLNNALMLAVSEWGPESVSDPETIPWAIIIGGGIGFLFCILIIHSGHGKRQY